MTRMKKVNSSLVGNILTITVASAALAFVFGLVLDLNLIWSAALFVGLLSTLSYDKFRITRLRKSL